MYTFGSVKKYICESFIFCLNIFFNKNNFSLLRIKFKTSEDIRQKYESLHTSVFQIHFAFSFKSFIFSLRRYFGRNDRFVQLNLKFLQPFGSFLCAFFKDLERAFEANTDIFSCRSQCQHNYSISVHVPEFEKYNKRYGDHDE